MARMKTFFLYFLGIVGFFILSLILEDGLITNMYKKIDGKVQDTQSQYGVTISDASARATNVNGYMSFKVKNNSENQTEKSYVQIDLYSERGLLAATKYAEVPQLSPGEEREYQVKIKGNNIENYNLSMINELPDKSNIISIFGWEFDVTNVFGMDLSNVTIFGVKLTEIFSWENAKVAGSNWWAWTVNFLSSIPWWGYTIAWWIVLWNMPAKFLFGIFPL